MKMSVQNINAVKLADRNEDVKEMDEFIELAKTVKDDLSGWKAKSPKRVFQDWDTVVPPIWDQDLMESYIENVVDVCFVKSSEQAHVQEKHSSFCSATAKRIDAASWRPVQITKDTQTEVQSSNPVESFKEIDKPQQSVRKKEEKKSVAQRSQSNPVKKDERKSHRSLQCLRFVGSLSAKPIDFSAQHPDLTLQQTETKVLFPRRSALRLEELPKKTKLSGNRQLEVDKPNDNTWHALLATATVRTEAPKILRYISKSNSPAPTPVQSPLPDMETTPHIQKNPASSPQNTNKRKEVIYDSKNIEPALQVPDLLKFKVQNLPILCIRGECKKQQAVNISIENGKFSNDDNSNVHYFNYVYDPGTSKPEASPCELTNDLPVESSPENVPDRRSNRFIAPFMQPPLTLEEKSSVAAATNAREFESSYESSTTSSKRISVSENSLQTDEEKLRVKRDSRKKKTCKKVPDVVHTSFSESSYRKEDNDSSSENSVINLLHKAFALSDAKETEKGQPVPNVSFLHAPNPVSIASDCTDLKLYKTISVQTENVKNPIDAQNSSPGPKDTARDIFNKILKDKSQFNFHRLASNISEWSEITNNSLHPEKVHASTSCVGLVDQLIEEEQPIVESVSLQSHLNNETNNEANFIGSRDFSEDNEFRKLNSQNSKKADCCCRRRNCSSVGNGADIHKYAESEDYVESRSQSFLSRDRFHSFHADKVKPLKTDPEFDDSIRSQTTAVARTLNNIYCTAAKTINKSSKRTDPEVQRAARKFLQSLDLKNDRSRSLSDQRFDNDLLDVDSSDFAFDTTSIDSFHQKQPWLVSTSSSINLTNIERLSKNEFPSISENWPVEYFTGEKVVKIGPGQVEVALMDISKDLTASTNSIEFHISKLKVLGDRIDTKSCLSTSSSNSSLKIVPPSNFDSAACASDGEVLSLGEVKNFSDESGF